jgi:hypothetical protein
MYSGLERYMECIGRFMALILIVDNELGFLAFFDFVLVFFGRYAEI